MARNNIIEKQLLALCAGSNSDIEFVEPYNGKKGEYSAEIYSRTHLGTVYGLFKDLGLLDDILTDNLGMRGGTLQIIIKTPETLEKFKSGLVKALENKKINFSFKMDNNISLYSYKKNKTDITSEEIANCFNLDENLITSIKDGLVQEIVIGVKDYETAKNVAATIREKLEKDNETSYGGLIKAGNTREEKASEVVICFSALEHLKKALSDIQENTKNLN